ncbi:hypothetical protein EVAR_57333_1 [Eumeta japonica]|uniref:Uncharacterized protein n=1 Tax=Eumeta variegata TaxID=151549 RepID=A0A4C1ZVE0_EUMVA|nr:hypothetical protein EVAR_57333_1 [Eumeta japonica]
MAARRCPEGDRGRVTCRGELRGNLAVGAKSELESLKNISREVKESVILKLQDISELALRLDESRSRYVVELEREKARRAAELEAAEKRFNKINQENLDRYSKMENKMEKLLAEVASTKEMLGQMRVPEALAEIRKVVARPAPRIMNYAEAAAKPRQRPPCRPWPSTRLDEEARGQMVLSCSSVEDAKDRGAAQDAAPT